MKGDVGQSRAGRSGGDGSEQRKRGREKSRESGEKMEEGAERDMGGR